MIPVNLQKYKRLFVFGCSFTSYHWSTWADVLSKEMPQAEFFNFGYCGGGNLLISIRIVEANLRYNFNEDDLIIVMWTTLCREDRYKNGRWWMTGNIFTASHDYPDEYVRKYADPKGYLIRDMALITQSNVYLNSLSATSVTLNSTPYDHQQDMSDPSIAPIMELYQDTCSITPPSLFELEMNSVWTHGHEYTNNQGNYKDYHPDPVRYCNYLKKLGFPITAIGEEYAFSARKLLHSTKTKEEIEIGFADLNSSKSKHIL